MEKTAVYKITIVVLVVALVAAGAYIVFNKTNNNGNADEKSTPAVPDPNATYNVSVTMNNPNGGSYAGSGPYKGGVPARLYANINPGYIFTGWYDTEGKLLSTTQGFTFTPTKNITLELRTSHDASFTVTIKDIDPDSALNPADGDGVLRKIITAVPNYTAGIEEQKWTETFFDGTQITSTYTSFSSGCEPVLMERLTITHWVQYTDGSTAESAWTVQWTHG